MRIRTDGDKTFRKDVIQDAAKVWGCNKTDAVVKSCDFTRQMIENLERVKDHPDMTPELAEQLSTRDVEVGYQVESSVDVDKGPLQK